MLQLNQLTGFGAGFLGLKSISLFASATSNQSSTITAPANILPGDLIVMADLAAGSSAPAAVTPTGFTQVATSVTSSNYRMCLSYKLAVGNEGGTSITGMTFSSGFGATKAIYVFRGDVAATSLIVGGANSQSTTGDPTSQNVTAASGLAPLVVLGAYGGSGIAGTVNPRTFSTTKDGEQEVVGDTISSDCDLWLAYKIYNSAPADTSIDMDDEGSSNSLMSGYIQMA